MKLVIFELFAVLVLFALYSEIDATSPPFDDVSGNCRGTEDLRCPQILCSEKGIEGWRAQDNSKSLPECCGGPICKF